MPLDKNNKHTLIYIYVYMFLQFLIMLRRLLTFDKCVTLFSMVTKAIEKYCRKWFLKTVLYVRSFQLSKIIFSMGFSTFSIVSTIENSKIFYSDCHITFTLTVSCLAIEKYCWTWFLITILYGHFNYRKKYF